MQRIIYAIILGLVFPMVCLVILGIIGDYLPESLMLAKLNNEPVPGILLFPFSIPVYMAIQDFLIKRKWKQGCKNVIIEIFLLT